MGFILDTILVLIVIACIYFSYQRGFIRTFVEAVGYVLALIIALNIGMIIAGYVFDNYVATSVDASIKSVIADQSDSAEESLPTYVTALIEKAGIDLDSITNAENINTAQLIDTIRPIAVDAIKSFISFSIFVLLLLIVKFLANFLNKLFSFTIINSLNRFLGGLLGAIKGALIAVAFCMAVYFIASVTVNDFLIFTEEAIEDSTICKRIIELISINN